MVLSIWNELSATLIYLLENVALLFALVFLYGATNFNPEAKQTSKKIIIGLMIGGFSVLVMNYPWELEAGIFYDTRSVLLSITAAFFGPVVGLISGSVALVYRFSLGGEGVYAGMMTIILSSELGILFHYRNRRVFKGFPTYIKYWIFGLVVSIATLIAQLLIPWPKAFTAIRAVWLPYVVFFPLVSIILGVAIENQINRLKASQILKEQKMLLQASIDSPKDMEIYAIDKDYNYLAYNVFHELSIQEYYGKSIKAGQNYFAQIEDDQMAYRIRGCFDKALSGERFKRIDEVETNKGKFLENFYAPIMGGHGEITGVTVFSHDVTERKHYEESIIYLSYHDALTGLKNRRFYVEELDLVEKDDEKLPVSVVMADINGLKIMNDAFGHDAGDELLKIVASDLKLIFGIHAEVARIGGDEFVTIMPNTSKGEALNLVEQAKHDIERNILKGMKVSVSFGVETKVDATSIQETIRIAEDDMYKHKLIETTSNRNESIKAILDTLNMKNPREEEHSKRVSEYCYRLGKILGLRQSELDLLRVVGILHDIGKIAIDERILNKEGKLNEEEWHQIHRHPEIGYRILSSSAEYAEISEDILCHHERWDGKGYPQGISGSDIPYRARIIAIADAYDAMTSERTYRKTLTKAEALEEIRRNAGTQFDPIMAMKFVEALEKENQN